MEGNEAINIGKVEALKSLRKDIKELQSRWDELSEPILEDFSLIPSIYNIYQNRFARRGYPEWASQPYHRRKFILIVLYLYSPRTLAGGKMRIGLRDSLAELFGLEASTTISDDTKTVVFYYKAYRDFRRDVDAMYKEISEKLLPA